MPDHFKLRLYPWQKDIIKYCSGKTIKLLSAKSLGKAETELKRLDSLVIVTFQTKSEKI